MFPYIYTLIQGHFDPSSTNGTKNTTYLEKRNTAALTFSWQYRHHAYFYFRIKIVRQGTTWIRYDPSVWL